MARIATSLLVATLVVALALGNDPGTRAGSHDRQRVLFGFNDDWDKPKNRSRLDYAEAARADVIRFPISWQRIEPQPGFWDWSRYDSLYAQASARGIRLIFTPQSSPCWAHLAAGCDLEGGVPPDPDYLAEYAEFVRRVVERYPTLVAVEVWNEPNLVPYWQPRPQPGRYAQLLRVTDDAVNEVDPKLPVLFGGLAGGNLSIKGSRLGYMRFLRRTITKAGGRRFDGLSIHSFNSLKGTLRILGRLRVELTGIGKSPSLWVTEIGFSSHAVGGEPRQARRLRASVRGISQAPDVRAVIVHRMFDVRPGIEPFVSMGMVRLDGSRKPVFCTVADLARRAGCSARGS